MKHVVASLTIGACLLLSSAGVVLAVDAHKASGGMPGRNGTNGSGVASCGGTQASPPGLVNNLNTNSPFPSAAIPSPNPQYAGVVGNSPNAGGHPASQYDNACFQHQVP
jgi:hypothetical protein